MVSLLFPDRMQRDLQLNWNCARVSRPPVVFIIRLSNLEFFFFWSSWNKKVPLHLSFSAPIFIFIDCHFRKTDDISELVYQLKASKLVQIGFMDIDPTSSDSLKRTAVLYDAFSLQSRAYRLIVPEVEAPAWRVLDGSNLSWPQVAYPTLVTLIVSR